MPVATARGSLEPYLKDSVEFYPHQIDGVRFLAGKRSFILADDMGLGKSLQAITLYSMDLYRGIEGKALIVCPVSLKVNWSEEFEKFTRIPTLVLDDKDKGKRTKMVREFLAQPGPGALIVNYEQVIGHAAQLNRHDWATVVYDEAHMLKNPDTKRTRASIRLQTRRRFILTGTPILNNVNEIWTFLHMIYPDRYSDYWAFVNRYCVYGGFKGQQIIGVKNEKELQDILETVMLRRLASEVLELKEPIPITRTVEMYPEQRELYERAKEDLMIIDPETGEEGEIKNSLVKFLRLKEICGTTKKFTGVDISGKFDRAMIDSKQIFEANNKAIVFTQFYDTLDAYQARLEEAGIPVWTVTGRVKPDARQAVVHDWSKDPRPGVILCTLQVAGVGLNMTAARYVQFLDKLYVPGLNNQAIARANRIGQDITKAVVVVNYQTKDSVESRIEEILDTKDATFKTIVEVAAMSGERQRNLLRALKEAA